jgi:hypothetical protein
MVLVVAPVVPVAAGSVESEVVDPVVFVVGGAE